LEDTSEISESFTANWQQKLVDNWIATESKEDDEHNREDTVDNSELSHPTVQKENNINKKIDQSANAICSV
jgi:hypothetical protein